MVTDAYTDPLTPLGLEDTGPLWRRAEGSAVLSTSVEKTSTCSRSPLCRPDGEGPVSCPQKRGGGSVGVLMDKVVLVTGVVKRRIVKRK